MVTFYWGNFLQSPAPIHGFPLIVYLEQYTGWLAICPAPDAVFG